MNEYQLLNPELVRESKNLLRTIDYDSEEYAELAASIKQKGLIHPIVVYQPKDSAQYYVMAGNRRLSAFKYARPTEPIPAIVVSEPKDSMTEISLAAQENLMRKSMTDKDWLNAVQFCEDQGIKEASKIARIFGKSAAWISQIKGVAKNPEAAKRVREGKTKIRNEVKQASREKHELCDGRIHGNCPKCGAEISTLGYHTKQQTKLQFPLDPPQTESGKKLKETINKFHGKKPLSRKRAERRKRVRAKVAKKRGKR